MKNIASILTLFLLIVLSFTLCKKKEESTLPASTNTTTTGPTNTTTTGSSTTTSTGTSSTTVTGTTSTGNQATQNSALTVGGAGWSYDACSVNPNALKAYNGTTQVQIEFGGGPIISMAYAFTAGVPTAGQARMTVIDAPGQPTGVNWYSKNGTVSVTTGTAGTTATFSHIGCIQQAYLFPVVTVSGTLTCN